ncbi:MAG: AAA family ATPase [Sarcina sp.]
MLINFIFENVYSFKEENFFSMECTVDKSFEKINTFETGHKDMELLKSSLVYGANASGKSNFIKSLKFMKNCVLYSVMPFGGVNLNRAFIFTTEGHNKESKYEIEFIIEKIKYRYGFTILKNKVTKEWLYKTKEREVNLFNRTSPDYKDIELAGDFKSAKNIKEMVSESSLFITVCKMLNHSIANKIWRWFYELEIITIEDQESSQETFTLLEEKPELKSEILKYLKQADIDIEDFSYEIQKSENRENIGDLKTKVETMKISNFKTFHKVYDENNELTNKKIELPFYEYQSDGTKKLFALIGPIFNAIEQGKILVIDEIDARFHPKMVKVILGMFNSIDVNSKNAQFICTTHDVLLLDEKLRKDQIWFVDKNEYSSSELYCLVDFKGIRKEDNILKKYLLGMFGAIPFEKEGNF